jgi:hypothetical protein
VLLIYLAFLAVTPLTIPLSIAAALLLACAIEFGQLYGVLSILAHEHNILDRPVLGTDFDPKDFFVYAAGGTAAWLGERVRCFERFGSSRAASYPDPCRSFNLRFSIPRCWPSAIPFA